MIRSLQFLGVRAAAFDATVGLYRDVLGLAHAARPAMVAAGVEFLGDPQRDGGVAWNHYRGPDGNVYEIIGRDRGVA